MINPIISECVGHDLQISISIGNNPRFYEMMDEIKAITGEAKLIMVRPNGTIRHYAIEDGELLIEPLKED